MITPIAITPGEPAGIGPDITVALLAQLQREGNTIPLVVIANRTCLAERAQKLGISIAFFDYSQAQHDTSLYNKGIVVLDIPLPKPCQIGNPTPLNATYVLACLERAVTGCLHQEFHAMVTGPVHKATINDAGIPFSGHTEYLAKLTHTAQTVMVLMTDTLKIALLTTHVPLKNVPMLITPDRLTTTLNIIQRDFANRFGIENPIIKVCGLNPHAGENGHLGTEEQSIIAPTLKALSKQGMKIVGPISADTAFTPDSCANCDIILAMYHDQGLPVIKSQDFGKAINVTLGLPIIRTSVDHGTALELAGTGQANHSSLFHALMLAAKLR